MSRFRLAFAVAFVALLTLNVSAVSMSAQLGDTMSGGRTRSSKPAISINLNPFGSDKKAETQSTRVTSQPTTVSTSSYRSAAERNQTSVKKKKSLKMVDKCGGWVGCLIIVGGSVLGFFGIVKLHSRPLWCEVPSKMLIPSMIAGAASLIMALTSSYQDKAIYAAAILLIVTLVVCAFKVPKLQCSGKMQVLLVLDAIVYSGLIFAFTFVAAFVAVIVFCAYLAITLIGTLMSNNK